MKDSLKQIRELIASDSVAVLYQTMGEYRTMLLRHIDTHIKVEEEKK